MKKEILILRISDREKEKLSLKAKENKMSMSEFVRELFRAYLIREEGFINANLNR